MDKILSVIIPSYNSTAYLDKCINSLIGAGKDCTDKLDIIVVNDGSTDGSEKIAQKFVREYPGSVRLINKENGGHGSAINEGAKAANGKYMKVLDADDWFFTDNLPAFISELEKLSSDVVLTHHHTINITNGEVKSWRSFPPQFGKEYTLEDIMGQWKNFDRSLTFHGITYRTDFYRQNGLKLLEHVFYEDHEYATFPCCLANGILPLDMFIYQYRIGDVTQSVSAENQFKRLSHTEMVLKSMTVEGLMVPKGGAADYRIKKTHLLLLSYLVTALLCDKNRRHGRNTADEIMKWYQENDTYVYKMSIKHYKILKVLNYAHVGLKGYNRILQSDLYNKIRHNKGFK